METMQIPLTDLISSLGIPGILGYFVWKEITGFMRQKKNGDDRGTYKDLREKVDKLGAEEKTFSSLTHFIEKQTYVMQSMLDQLRDNKDRLQRIEDILHKR